MFNSSEDLDFNRGPSMLECRSILSHCPGAVRSKCQIGASSVYDLSADEQSPKSSFLLSSSLSNELALLYPIFLLSPTQLIPLYRHCHTLTKGR